jgi:hypothetical protein
LPLVEDAPNHDAEQVAHKRRQIALPHAAALELANEPAWELSPGKQPHVKARMPQVVRWPVYLRQSNDGGYTGSDARIGPLAGPRVRRAQEVV